MPMQPRNTPQAFQPFAVPNFIQKGLPLLLRDGRMGLVVDVGEETIQVETSSGHEYMRSDEVVDAGNGALRQENAPDRPFKQLDLYDLVLAVGWAKRHYNL